MGCRSHIVAADGASTVLQAPARPALFSPRHRKRKTQQQEERCDDPMGKDEEYLVVSRSAIVKIVRAPPISVLKSIAGRNEVPAASGKSHPRLTAVNCGGDEQRCIAGRDHINPQIVVAVEAAMGELAVIAQGDKFSSTDQQPQ